MDFKSLNHVVAVAGSFVRAAEQVCLTQSAVSRSISSIEEQLGVRLFDRTPAGVFLTPAGEVFVVRARHILAETRALVQAAMHDPGDIGGQVTLGAVPTLAVSCLGSLMARCVEDKPQLSLAVKVSTLPQLAVLLREHKLEFVVAISDVPGVDSAFEQQTIGTVRRGGVFCRPGHPLCCRGQVSSAELCHYPLAVSDHDRTLERFYREILGLPESEPLPIRLICDNLLLLQQVVTRTDTLLVTSQTAMTDLVEAGVFAELPVARAAPIGTPGEVVILTLKGRSLSPASRYLIGQLRELFAGAAAAPPG